MEQANEVAMMPALRDRTFRDDEPVVVSICSITYNHAPFIRACLEGFLDQVAPFRIEVVIYDDCSTDGTADILREYAARYPTVFRCILNTKNEYSLGVNPYYAYVFPQASGTYIAICDGDDYWADPDKLRIQASVLDADPDTVITYGRTNAISGTTVTTDYRNGEERDLSAFELKTCSGLNTLTTCFRNPRLSGPPPYLRNSPIGDLTVWALLGKSGGGRFLPQLKPTVYRLHDGGIMSGKNQRTMFYMSLLGRSCIAAHLDDDHAAEEWMLARAAQMIIRKIGILRFVRLVAGRAVKRGLPGRNPSHR